MASGSLSDKSRSLSPFTQRRNWRGVNLINPLQNEKWTVVFGWFSVFETHVRPLKATSYAGELSNRLPSEVCGHQAKIDDNRFFFGRRFSVFYSRVTWFDKSEESREGWNRPPPWCSRERRIFFPSSEQFPVLNRRLVLFAFSLYMNYHTFAFFIFFFCIWINSRSFFFLIFLIF